jgi:VWFA-related protein
MLRLRATPWLAAAIIAPVLLAQPPAAPRQQPTFRAGTNVVRVDVTVLDKSGKPLTDLTRDDFIVAEDGVPQTVDAFRLVEANGQPTDNLSLPIRSREHAYAEAARDDVRVFVIFWDEYHIDRFAPAIRARAALTDFVANAFGPTDLVAITDQLTPSDAIDLTRDRRALAAAAAKLQGRRGVYIPVRSPMEEAQLYRPREVEFLRSQVTRSALEATVGFLGTIKEGRKSLLLVTEDLGPMGLSDQTDWLRDFIQRANQNNTAVYTFDPRGIGLTTDLLQTISAETGAEAIRSNDPAKRLQRMVTESSAFYLLGYSSSQNPADGKFHKIDVHVNRPGVQVRARRGYFAPTLAEISAGRAAARAAEVPPDVSNALSELVDGPADTDGELWVGTAPGTGAPRMTVAWLPSDAHSGAVRLTVTGAGGRVFYDDGLNGTASFDVAPGAVEVKRTLVGPDGASLGSRSTRVEVPDYASVPLAIASPALYRSRTGIERREIETNPDLPPFAGHSFDRTDQVVVRFLVAGTAASSATVKARLLNKSGTPLVELPLTPHDGRFETVLTIASLARGDYLVEITAASGSARAKALVPLRVN